MAISKRKRRKIVYQNSTFLWWVEAVMDNAGNMLRLSIASEDKKFIVKYYAVQTQKQQSFITVVGEAFPKLQKKTGHSVNLLCPDFSVYLEGRGISSKMVRAVLEWCFEGNLP